MDHDELKQWLTETSVLLDEMDSEVTGRVREWATFRATFKQAGDAVGALEADAEEAREQLAAAYRSEGALAQQVLRDAHACAKAILVAGRSAADDILAAAKSEGEQAREEAKAQAVATLRDARDKAEEAVASAERLAAQKMTEVRREAEFMLDDARQKAAEMGASAEHQAAEAIGAARHEAETLLADAEQKGGEALAAAEREAAEQVTAARRDADALLADARRNAGEALAAAEREAAEKFAEAERTLDDARRRADAVKNDTEQYVGGMIAKMERLLPQQEELARAVQHLMQEYSTVVATVGRVQTNARGEVIPRLRRLLAMLKSDTAIAADVVGGPAPADASESGQVSLRSDEVAAMSGPSGLPEPAFEPTSAEAALPVGHYADVSESHPTPARAQQPDTEQPASIQSPSELTGTVALEGTSDALTDRFVEAMTRLPRVKRAVLATRWQVPRLAMIDVTIDGDSLAGLDFSALPEFTVRVTNTTQTMVVLRVEERVDAVDIVTSQSAGADHRG
jgi:vacuolar-type H+-ATPase subunit H